MPEPAAILRCIRENPPRADETVVIFLAEDGAPSLSTLQQVLLEQPAPFIGAIFPGLIFGAQAMSQGALVMNLPVAASVCVPDLSSGLFTLPPPPPQAQTVLVCVDGLTSHITLFLSEMYRSMGNTLRYFGGGAGSRSLEQKPCLFDRDGVYQDTALLLFLPQKSHLVVCHGWEPLYGPMLATHTQHNIIHQLNWRPVLEVYRSVVEDDCGEVLTRERFSEISKNYPFGLVKAGNELVIRDPVRITADGGLQCVGEVPEYTVISVLRGNPDTLIAAAGEAIQESLSDREAPIQTALIADGISRSVFLADRFEEELQLISEQLRSVAPDVTLTGALTLGEISSVRSSYLEFFNKTCVIAALTGAP